MDRFRTTARLIMAILMVAVAMGGHQASAQRPGTTISDEGSYESELTGLEFTWSEDWEEVSTDVTGEDEILELESEYGPLYVGFTMEDDAETARDVVVDGFLAEFGDATTLDEGESRGFAWSLIEVESDQGDLAYLYVEVEEDFVDDYDLIAVTATEEDAFLDQYELVNDTVEIDGDAVFNEFDVDEVEEMLGGAGVIEDGDTSIADDESPVVDDEATPTDDEDQSETGRIDDGASDSYMFETDDIELTVTDDVQINDTQVEEDSYEQVLLVGMGSIGAVSLMQSPLDAEDTLEGFIEGFMSEMEDSAEIDSGVDGDVAWTLYEATIGGTDMYVYATTTTDLYDGSYLELIAAPVDFFEDEFQVYQESVQINGDGMFNSIDIDDLLEIIDGA